MIYIYIRIHICIYSFMPIPLDSASTRTNKQLVSGENYCWSIRSSFEMNQCSRPSRRKASTCEILRLESQHAPHIVKTFQIHVPLGSFRQVMSSSCFTQRPIPPKSALVPKSAPPSPRVLGICCQDLPRCVLALFSPGDGPNGSQSGLPK